MVKKMKAHVIKSCLAYLYGSGAIDQIGEFCRDELLLKGGAVIVTDNIVWKIAGKKISENLQNHGFKTDSMLVTTGTNKPDKEEVDKAREKIRSIDASVVLGVGGGVNMDVSKAAAAEENIRIITAPTIFATEAQTMSGAVFRDDYRPARGYRSIFACVVDTDVIKSAPWRFQASGFGDIMGKASGIFGDWQLACEREKPWTKDVSNILGWNMAKLQLSLLQQYADGIANKEEKAFDLMLQAFMIDGEVCELCRPAGSWGTEHRVAHGIEDFANVYHGEAVGVGAILMSCLQGGDWKTLKNKIAKVGGRVTAKQLGVSDDTIVKALTDASDYIRSITRTDYYTILHEKPLNKESAAFLARLAGVIE